MMASNFSEARKELYTKKQASINLIADNKPSNTTPVNLPFGTLS